MGYTVIRNGTLIDGKGGPPLKDGAILIKDNRIHQAGPANHITLPSVNIAQIDARGGVILPGFIDTHVHMMLEDINISRMMTTPFSLRFYQSVGYMRRTLEAGITSVRDAGGADAGLKQAVDNGLIVGPRLQISIVPLTITGGHGDGWMLSGDEFHLLPEWPGMPDGRCDGVEGVRKKVREVLRAGAEVVKVHATGGCSARPITRNSPSFHRQSCRSLSRKQLSGGVYG